MLNNYESVKLKDCKIAVILEYDGTNYHGFQIQDNACTIQGEVESALQRMTGLKVRIKAASRTDAGAHARGQVVAFTVGDQYNSDTYVKALNHYLPLDIRVRRAFEVPLDFEPRRDAISRVYRYTILQQDTPPALLRHTAYWMTQEMNVKKMSMAASNLVGRHNFREFSGTLESGDFYVRKVYRCDIRVEENCVIIETEANSFLPHQVRRTASVLVEIGKNMLPIESIQEALHGERKFQNQAPLPAKGLCLMKVNYPNPITEVINQYAYAEI